MNNIRNILLVASGGGSVDGYETERSETIIVTTTGHRSKTLRNNVIRVRTNPSPRPPEFIRVILYRVFHRNGDTDNTYRTICQPDRFSLIFCFFIRGHRGKRNSRVSSRLRNNVGTVVPKFVSDAKNNRSHILRRREYCRAPRGLKTLKNCVATCTPISVVVSKPIFECRATENVEPRPLKYITTPLKHD